MGKRFVATHDADRRALTLCVKLQEITEMPLVKVILRPELKKVILAKHDDPTCYRDLSVDFILSIDVPEAKAKGGTFDALLTSRRSPPYRVPGIVVAEDAHRFLSGEDD